MFVLTLLEKFKETRLKFSQRSVIKMVNYEERILKQTNIELSKLKSATKK